jgi:Ca2+-transporting ATPase
MMMFVVKGLGTMFNALTNRRDPASGLIPPILTVGVAIVPVALIFLATQLPSLQHELLSTPLTGPQCLAAIGLALALPLVIEAGKWIRRQRTPELTTLDTEPAVAPGRALNEPAR